MSRRLIIVAVALIILGTLPTILDTFFSYLNVHIVWPTTLPDIPWVPLRIRQWIVDYGSFRAIAIVGVVLLVVAALLAGRKLLDEQPKSEPVRTIDVLMQEAATINDAIADAELRQNADAFYAGLKARETAQSRLVGHSGDGNWNELSAVSPRVYCWLNRMNRTSLCLSGGGIRSASFALGVLQALAIHPRGGSERRPVGSADKSLLAEFHYLSTVSGGGYIGGWFSAWVQQSGYARVWRDLVRHPDREQDPGEQASPIKWLRVHGNYLTPKLGLSGDTLADIAIFLRNLLLNWLVLLPLLCAVLIFMKLMALEVFQIWKLKGDSGAKYWVPLLAWLVLLVSALSFSLRNRPTRTHDQEQQATEIDFLKWGLVPSTIAALAFTLFLALAVLHVGSVPELCDKAGPLTSGNLFSDCELRAVKNPSLADFIGGAIVGALIYALSYAISWIKAWPKASARAWRRVRALLAKEPRPALSDKGSSDFWRWTLSGGVYGALVMVITFLFLNNDAPIERLIFFDFDWFNRARAPTDISGPRHLLALIYLGVPLLLGAQLIAEMIFVGLTSEEPDSEEDREWLGRAAGLFFLTGLGWLVVMHLAYIGSDITYKLIEFFIKHPLEALGVLVLLYVVGAVAAGIGKSSRTPARREQSTATTKSASTTLSLIATILGVTLVIGMSALVDYVALGHAIAEDVQANPSAGPLQDDRLKLFAALVIVLLVALVSSRSININRFSMHALYRNRLIRTFLGASNPKRRPNPFTNFAPEDNPPMHTLWPSRHAWSGEEINDKGSASQRSWRPFHIVNIALNVTSSREHLEWQERKAASFTVSPLHCGSSITGFRNSEVYGDGISLGTAMAVSGAAASPNQGYNSSPSVAFLMALFNVRLGWWLGNPGPRGATTHTYDGPKNAAVPFLAEMLGMTSDDNKYVYLSDGGHFENLGLYEMVRRRCRFIVLVDAGCDPEFKFEDLGNAVRKIEIDLGVPITFRDLDKLRARKSKEGLEELLGGLAPPRADRADSKPAPYHAIGVIDYPSADGHCSPGGPVTKGVILYIKPSYHGTESSAGIRSYASMNPHFPHDDTANQFFGESQMESYRALGFEITDTLLRKAVSDLKPGTEPTLRALINALAGPDAVAEAAQGTP
jgi:hypothetical protein